MLTATIPPCSPRCPRISSNRLAGRVAMICLLAWTGLAIRPLLAVERVAEATVDIALPAGALPQNMAALRATISPGEGDRRLGGGWAMTTQSWAAANLRYQPLYFEEINLERYGYTSCHLLQPLISAARFFATIPALPYKMVLQRPCRPNYALGHDRPGSRVPWYWQRLPLQTRAGLVEAGVVVGLIFLIP